MIKIKKLIKIILKLKKMNMNLLFRKNTKTKKTTN